MTLTVRLQPWFGKWARSVVDRAVRDGTEVDYAFILFMAGCAMEVS